MTVMKENRIAFLLIFILFSAAVSGVIIRSRLLRNRADLRGEMVWVISYDITIKEMKAGALLRIGIPDTGTGVRVFRETFEYDGIVMDILRNRRTRCREAVCVKRGGENSLRFQADFEIQQLQGEQEGRALKEKTLLTTADRAFYLKSEEEGDGLAVSLKKILASVKNGNPSKGEIVNRIHQFCSDELIHDEEIAESRVAETLQGRKGNTRGIAQVMMVLCRKAVIPTRVVTGFLLQDDTFVKPHVWIEVYLKKTWVPFDPVYGYSGSLPAGYIAVRKDSPFVVKTSEGVGIHEVYSVRPPSGLGKSGDTDKTPSDILVLSRLSSGMKKTLSLIMLLTAGALVTACFRNIIGIQTFGTFTPALLALSLVYKNIQIGITIFVVVITCGLFGRYLIDRLKLLMVPRLGAVLTLVVLCLVFTVSALEYFNITPSAHAVLFPTVIVTMLIERFFIQWEEKGFIWSLRVFGGTCIAAAICLVFFKIKILEEVFLNYPEILLVIMALFIVIGRYSGYRLSELRRFRTFSEEGDQR